jgi:protease PrsW
MEGRAMPEGEVCCICGAPASPEASAGGRPYCARHRAALDRPHPGFWRAGLVQIAGMALFTAVVAAVAGQFGPLARGPLLISAGLFLALVPSALWLAYFYHQDRLEPEPKAQIAAVFGLALLLTEAVGRRAIDDWLAIGRWVTDPRVALLASLLVAGPVLQAIAYFAVRATVYATPEFDERMDGVVYGTVAGLGVATLLNLRYVLDNAGVALAPGVIQTATVALAQAACGGVMGYFMAGAKFERRPAWWTPLGLIVAAAINGLSQWLLREVATTGLTVQPWRQLALGLAVAVAVFAALVALMRRSTEVTLARRAG